MVDLESISRSLVCLCESKPYGTNDLFFKCIEIFQVIQHLGKAQVYGLWGDHILFGPRAYLTNKFYRVWICALKLKLFPSNYPTKFILGLLMDYLLISDNIFL